MDRDETDRGDSSLAVVLAVLLALVVGAAGFLYVAMRNDHDRAEHAERLKAEEVAAAAAAAKARAGEK